jgi:hypothetical protein
VRRFSRKTTIIVTSLALVIVTSVAAYAFWTTSGAGTGSASSGSGTAITVNQTSGVSGLYPGGPAVTLSGNFNNPNANPVFVNAVTATISAVHGGSLPGPSCTTGDFALGGSTGVVGSVPFGNGVGSWSGLTIEMLETGANQDNCKNATLDISYSTS